MIIDRPCREQVGGDINNFIDARAEYLPSIIKYSWSPLCPSILAGQWPDANLGKTLTARQAGYCTIMTGWNVTVSPECRAAEAVASFVQLVTLCLGGDTDTLTIYLHNIYHPHVSVSQSSLH